MTEKIDPTRLALIAQVAAAFLANNPPPGGMEGIPALLATVRNGLDALEAGPLVEGAPLTIQKPAVPVKKSITPDFLICLEDGKKLKMLKRYLWARYDMRPDDYRARWGLARDYPMVAPNYAMKRSEVAKAIGLGTHANTNRTFAKARAKK
jgi:predicted transcriptional regulator